jgi:hypothetical protein
VIEESLCFAKQSDDHDFQASSEWLDSFTSRNLIPQKKKKKREWKIDWSVKSGGELLQRNDFRL